MDIVIGMGMAMAPQRAPSRQTAVQSVGTLDSVLREIKADALGESHSRGARDLLQEYIDQIQAKSLDWRVALKTELSEANEADALDWAKAQARQVAQALKESQPKIIALIEANVSTGFLNEQV